MKMLEFYFEKRGGFPLFYLEGRSYPSHHGTVYQVWEIGFPFVHLEITKELCNDSEDYDQNPPAS